MNHYCVLKRGSHYKAQTVKDTVAINKIKKKTNTFNDFKFLCHSPPACDSHKSLKFQSPLAALISSSLTIKNNHNLFIMHVLRYNIYDMI